jgi:hypothetical protein
MIVMKVYKYNMYKIGLVALISVAIIACNPSDFGDLNDDPNNTTKPETSLLLTSILRNISGTMTASISASYVQYVGNSQYTDADNYLTIKFSFNTWYDGPLADLQFIIDYNTNEETKAIAGKSGSNENQIGVAKILKSYYFLFMTNRWGDIPYSEALQAASDEQILSPKYDTQQQIYTAVFAELKDARNLILADQNDAPVVGDILFNGDMNRWVEFANTMRLFAALNMSESDEATARTEFNSALADGVITSDVNYSFLAEAANENPWFTSFRTRDDWTTSEPIVTYMNINTELNPFTLAPGKMDVVRDARLYAYGNPPDNTIADPTYPLFAGQPYGLSQPDAGAIAIQDVSMLGFHMRQQDLAYPIYQVAAVYFSRAEAAERGWTSENAQQMYYNGIAASFDRYGVTDGPNGDGVGGYDDYITNTEVAWTAGRELEQIAMQKWVALYLNGYQGWDNWRRTGWPVLTPSPNGIQSTDIPIRQAYPDTERDLNGTNWQAALDSQFGGVDNLNGKLWLYPRSDVYGKGMR